MSHPSCSAHLAPLAHRRAPGIATQFQAWLLVRFRLWRDERFLANQPDYLLKDIGVSRTDIPRALRDGDR